MKDNTITIYTTISESNGNLQETYGSGNVKNNKKFVEMSLANIEEQINKKIIPMIEKLKVKDEKSTLALSKIKLKLGFSLEGKLYIANGKIESAIELEFTK